jgi:hypothetical protein
VERLLAPIVEAAAYAAIDEILPMDFGVPRLIDRPACNRPEQHLTIGWRQGPDQEGKVDQQPLGPVALECAIALAHSYR